MNISHSNASELLASFFDEGSFVELGAHIRRNARREETEGVVCGYGAVNSRLVFAFAQDGTRAHGAVDDFHARKIAALYELAIKNGAIVIGIFDSNGASILDGFSSVSAYGKILRCITDAKGRIPQIALLKGVCNGTMAAAFELFDIKLSAGDDARLYVAPPSLIGEDNGTPVRLASNGLVDKACADLDSALESIKELIALLPDNCARRAVDTPVDDVQRDCFLDDESVRVCIEEISDGYKYFELSGEYAPDIITAIAQLGGVSVGIIANDAKVNSARISPEGAEKAAAFIRFCDSFSLPLITLASSEGAEMSQRAEDSRIAASMARLANAYAIAKTPKVTLISGKLYGAACVLMGAKSLGADIVYALESATVGALSPEAAVAFLENSKVDSQQTRKKLEEEWAQTNLSPERAAESGDIDDIISPYDARRRICSAIYMLAEKNTPLCPRHTGIDF